MVWYAQADHDAFATTDAQEEEFAADLAAYKLTIQDKNPDEFKELVETYTQPNIRSTSISKRSECKNCSWSRPQEEQLQDSKQ